MSNVIEFSIKALDDFSATMGKFGTSLSKTEQAFAALGITAAAYAALRLAKASLDNADAMGIAAEKANMTVEAFSELAWAAKLSNVEQGSLTTGLKMLNKAISEGDMSPAGRQLEALGIASRDANGNLRSTEDVMMDVADAFKNGANDGNKTKIAMELLGRSGTDMVPFLNQGRDAIMETREEAKKLGAAIGDDFSQSANQVNDNLDKMSQMLTGSFNAAMKSVSPVIENLTNHYIDLAVESGGIEKTGETIATAFRLIASAAIIVAAVIQALGDAIGAVAAAAVAAASGDFSGAAKILSSAYSKSVDIVSEKMGELDVVWSENVKSAAVVTKATEKMAAGHKKSMKTVADADVEVKRTATEYADVYKRLTELLKASETPYATHARRIKEITQVQKDLGGTSDELTAALKKENAEWDKAKIATDQYKTSATSVVDTMHDMYAAEMESMGSIAYQTAEIMLETWKTASKGIADAVGESLVYGSSFKDGMESLAKQILSTMISSFVEMGIAGVASGTAVSIAWWPITVVVLAIIAAVYIMKKAYEEFGDKAIIILAPIAIIFYVIKEVIDFISKAVGDLTAAIMVLFGLGGGVMYESLKFIAGVFQDILNLVKEIINAVSGLTGGIISGLTGGNSGGGGDLLSTVIGGPVAWGASAVSSVGGAIGRIRLAGGGYTGDGSRSGGLDGQGGFMAMLHPQETVIDHAQGQGGGVVVQNLTIHVLENATNTDAFRGMNKIELRNALGQPVVDALNEMFSIGVRPNFAMVNR